MTGKQDGKRERKRRERVIWENGEGEQKRGERTKKRGNRPVKRVG